MDSRGSSCRTCRNMCVHINGDDSPFYSFGSDDDDIEQMRFWIRIDVVYVHYQELHVLILLAGTLQFLCQRRKTRPDSSIRQSGNRCRYCTNKLLPSIYSNHKITIVLCIDRLKGSDIQVMLSSNGTQCYLYSTDDNARDKL